MGSQHEPNTDVAYLSAVADISKLHSGYPRVPRGQTAAWELYNLLQGEKLLKLAMGKVRVLHMQEKARGK